MMEPSEKVVSARNFARYVEDVRISLFGLAIPKLAQLDLETDLQRVLVAAKDELWRLQKLADEQAGRMERENG